MGDAATIDTSHVPLRDPWRYLLSRFGLLQIGAALAMSFAYAPTGGIRLALYYFLDQDRWLLLFGGSVLLLLSWLRLPERPLPGLTATAAWTWSALAAVIAYAGTFLIVHRYPLSGDEQSATLAMAYGAGGHLGWAVPPGLHDLARAMMPLYGHVLGGGRYLASVYLPVSGALRALTQAMLGDGWLAGPLLLVAGAMATWQAALRLWPASPHAASVALVLALASPQVLMNAMTPFATTAHFALNAIWLACFLRGGRYGHGAALLVGFAATGLHQWHFHMMFVAGFVGWLWLDRQRPLALVYAGACVVYLLVWQLGYPALLEHVLGRIAIEGPRLSFFQTLIARLHRIDRLEPAESLARFTAWHVALLLPLALAGATALRRADGRWSPLLGCALACALGLLTLTFQDRGFGYRYLHGLIPAFCLLAARGWLVIEEQRGRLLPAAGLWAAVLATLVLALPFAAWRSMAYAAPFEAAYRLARAAPADYVVVDTRHVAYLQDIVRVDPDHHGPVLLDLAWIPAASLARLCRTDRVMLFDDTQARALHMNVAPGAVGERDPIIAARRRLLARLHCDTPVSLS